ncbi:hypothetical protein K1719_034869 [Acacia pycnantha]|nr:hypothetical protein K1719_034869 [Acacia pycnantha]
MVKKLRQLWEQKGNIGIFDLQNDFYLVSFQHVEDYIEAFTSGPWVINDAYLNVARWKPDFNPKNECIETVVAWVRFPDLPAPLFDKKFLLNLDLTKPLVPEFEVEGQSLSVVYDSLGMLCTKCGMFGHVKDGCEDFQYKKYETRMDVEDLGDKKRGDKGPEEVQRGSHFAVLEEETSGEGVQKEFVVNGSHVNVQEEVLTKELKKQGKQDNLSDGKMSSRGNKVKNKDVGEQRGKIMMEGRAKKASFQGKLREELEKREVVRRRICIPGNCDADMELETVKNEKGLEARHDCNSMANENVYATLELADDQGVASKGVATVIRDMRRRYRIDIVVILEPRISGSNANKTIKGRGFKQSRKVETEVTRVRYD